MQDLAATPRMSIFDETVANTQVAGQQLNIVAGEPIYQADTPAEKVYFIQRGQVRIYQEGPDGSSRLLEILGPGDWCGAEALAHLPGYGTVAVAVGPVTVTEVAVDNLFTELSQQPRVAVELTRQLATKLHAAREDAARLVFDDCHNRLLKTLVRFSRSAAATPHTEGVVLRITHHQLAQAVGVARETISLALTQLRQRNLLRTGRNQLTFNPDALRKLSEPHNGTNGTNGSNGNHHPVAEPVNQ